MSSEQVPTPAQVAKSEAAKQVVILAAAVLTMCAVTVMTQPDSLRTLRMRSAAASSQLLASASRAAGRLFMRIELLTGAQHYQVPYRLSLLRDTARQMYKRDSDGGSRY